MAASAADPFASPPPPEPPSAHELRTMRRAFGNAKDRWQIDTASLKCFYLHSESGYLYIWNQPTGILYEYEQSTGQCQTVWSSAVPQLNAELWMVLPLPPTDPASFQASCVNSETLPNMDVYLVLSVAHESGRQVPKDVLDVAVDDFCTRTSVEDEGRKAVLALPPAGQGYIIQNFRTDTGSCDPSKALISYIRSLQTIKPPPWGNSACTLRVEVTGAIIGRCCPDLEVLCREDPPERLAQAQCKITSEQDRFFICDMGTSQEGTLLDGFALNETWVGPLKTGSLITIGPLRIKIQLSDMAKDTPLEGKSVLNRSLNAGEESDDGADEGWKRKVFRQSEDDKGMEWKRRKEQYRDRADERRQRTTGEAGQVAVDALINRFEKIQEAEEAAAAAEDARVEMPTQEAHREVAMNVDGSFLGSGGLERAGIGFRTSMGEELIPNVLDPKHLSQQDASRLKTQLRFKQTR